MNREDSTWPSDFSSSACSDDDSEDEDYVGSRHNAGTSRTKRSSRQSPRLASSEKENKKNQTNPLPARKSQKEATRKSPSSPMSTTKAAATATAIAAISRNSPLASSRSSRSIRKRRLPRPSNGHRGNLSDSSSSSDDSLLFRSSHSLTGITKIAKKKATMDNNSMSNNYSGKKGEDEKSCSSPGIKPHRFNAVGKNNGKNAVMDNIQQFDEEANASSDSDDTAELMRQLTRKPSPSSKFAAGSSFPSSPKPKLLRTDGTSHQDNTYADNEGSLNNGDDYDCTDDGMDESTTMRQPTRRLASISGSTKPPPPQSLPEGVICANNINTTAATFPSSDDFQYDNVPNNKSSLHDTTSTSNINSNSPVQFELPTQSSSSEEESSCSGEEEEGIDSDVEERENRSTMNPTNSSNNINDSDDWHSFGEGAIAKDGENESRRQGHEAEQNFSTQTDRELFEAAFDDHDTTLHGARNTNTAGGSRSEDREQLHHTTSPQKRQDLAAAGRRCDAPCIDLVDSDDNCEQEQQQTIQIAAREHQTIFENEESPRSPTRRRSPRFNVAARNFFYNKPWTNTSNHRDRQGEEDTDDVVQFEDEDDSKVPARSSRRVTQDHANHIINHQNDNSGVINNLYEESSVSNNYFQQRLSSSNPPNGYQEQSPEHQQQHQQHIPRPWTSGALQTTTRRLRDPAASNVSLAASVVMKNPYASGGRKSSERATPSTKTDARRNQAVSQRSTQQHRRNDANIGDIRTFVRKRPILANETRNRARSIEAVRANRHDIQGHANVTVVNHAPPVATRRRSRSQQRSRAGGGEEEEDVIEVFDDEVVEDMSLAQFARSRRAPAAKPKAAAAKPKAAAAKPKAKAKPKRKRAASTKRTKSRKTGGRKRTRKAASSRGKSKGGGGRFGRRGGNSTTGSNNNDSGAWGDSGGGGGWASARPVHREDPAFQNVGAQITF